MQRSLLAKRRLEPTWLSTPVYVDTYGPQVCDLAAAAGFAPYPEQELLMDLLFAVGPDGRSVSFETDWVAPRQVMKTGGILIAEIGWLYVTKQKLIVHSAHELSTTEEAFNDLAAIIERTPALSKRLKPTRGERPGIFEGNGRWSIHLKDGQRVKYKARLKTGGRGLTGWKVVLDEGFALTPAQMGSLLPTLTSVPDPQFLIASSAGMAASGILRDARDRGRAGTDPTQTYAEWGDRKAWQGCASPDCTHAKNAIGCALDDEDRWAEIIPGLGERIQVNTIRGFRRSMPPEEFLREFMVWWDEPEAGAGKPAIDLKAWGQRANAEAQAPRKAVAVIAVEPDQSSASIGVAGVRKNGETPVLLDYSGEGTGWVVDRLTRLKAKVDLLEVALHPRTQAGALKTALRTAGFEVTDLTSTDYGQGCAGFLMELVSPEPGLAHLDQVSLNATAAVARTRKVGEQLLWDAAGSPVPLSPLVATSTAWHRWQLQEIPEDVPNLW